MVGETLANMCAIGKLLVEVKAEGESLPSRL
jgi:hypothetical protein